MSVLLVFLNFFWTFRYVPCEITLCLLLMNAVRNIYFLLPLFRTFCTEWGIENKIFFHFRFRYVLIITVFHFSSLINSNSNFSKWIKSAYDVNIHASLIRQSNIFISENEPQQTCRGIYFKGFYIFCLSFARLSFLCIASKFHLLIRVEYRTNAAWVSYRR